MKFKRIYGALIATALFSTGACNKYLDVNPDNRTEINSVDKVAQLTATAYPSYDYYYFTESASDNAEDKGAGEVIVSLSMPYAWKDVQGDDTGSPTQYWNGCYSAIAAANQALESIESYKLGAAVNPYKGEALVCRAYAHFMLVTFFSKVYKPGDANSSPGVPYVTAPETKVIQKYDRETVAVTYQKIEKDLTEGLALLNSSAYKVPKYHFTPEAAHAFAARFYLFKGEWQKAADHASACVPSGNFTGYIRPTNSAFRTMGYNEYNLAFSRSDQKSNLLISDIYSAYQRTSGSRYGYGQQLTNMFDKDHNYTKSKPMANWILNYGVPNYTTYKWKEYFHRVSPNASTGFHYIMSVLLTTDEALMIRAEAYTELGQYDKAMQDMTLMYSNIINNYSQGDAPTMDKIKAYYGLADSKAALIAFILDTKKSQFLQEGIRWMDIIRRGLTVTHNMVDSRGVETFTELKPDDNRRVFQIPEEAKLSGVELNPR